MNRTTNKESDMKKTSKKAPKSAKERYAKAKYCIIANKSYGLYAGLVDSFDAANGVVQAREVRHVARWYGKTGGITSLAAHGLCGPSAGESRIGAPVERATLTGVVNVFECSPEARGTLEAATQS